MDSDVYRAIEAANKRSTTSRRSRYMQTGATDMAFHWRAKGMRCYGVSLATDEEDVLKGFAAHSDQERVLEDCSTSICSSSEVLGSHRVRKALARNDDAIATRSFLTTTVSGGTPSTALVARLDARAVERPET